MTVGIHAAIATCEAAHNKESGARAYEALLSAAGNNHAGTYNSSVLALVSEIRPVVNHGQPWAQHAALEALIDLYASFEPEPTCQVYLGEQLAVVLRQRIAAMEPDLAVIAKSAGIASGSAQSLLELLHEPAA